MTADNGARGYWQLVGETYYHDDETTELDTRDARRGPRGRLPRDNHHGGDEP